MKFIKDWMAQRKQRKLEIESALKIKREAEEEKAKQEANMRLIMDSDMPWYKITGKPYTIDDPPLEPVSERYVWNKAFVYKLRQEGYKGETDYEVIGNWEVAVENERVKRITEIDRENKKKSSEPWVEIISENYDEATKQVQINLDWNPAFIKMLRQNGYTGRDEAEIVDKWFKRLSDDIARDLHGVDYGA